MNPLGAPSGVCYDTLTPLVQVKLHQCIRLPTTFKPESMNFRISVVLVSKGLCCQTFDLSDSVKKHRLPKTRGRFVIEVSGGLKSSNGSIVVSFSGSFTGCDHFSGEAFRRTWLLSGKYGLTFTRHRYSFVHGMRSSLRGKMGIERLRIGNLEVA